MLLALDTSTSQAGLALYDGGVVTELVWRAGRDHGRSLMPAVEQSLSRLGLKPTDLTAVAAARGPGSFTGLRVGLAVAQGLAVALGIPLYGVGSLAVLANGLPPLPDPVLAVLEAGRGRFATARFRAVASGGGQSGGYEQEGEVVGLDLDALVRVAGTPSPDDERCVVVGEVGAEARARLAMLGERVWVAPPALAVRRPAVLAELGWRRHRVGRPPDPAAGEPIYLARA